MVFAPNQFSEIVRTLSPGRFRRFMERALDIERGYTDEPILTPLRTSKKEFTPSELSVSFFQYTKRSVSGWGYIKDESSQFIISHHVPSLITDRDYLDILTRDLKHLTKSIAYQDLLWNYDPRNTAVYYGTNKDYGPQWRHNQEEWRRGLQDALGEAEVDFIVNCIDPYTIGDTLAQDAEEVLLDTLRQPDGIAIEVSESGISIRPFVASDAYVSDRGNSVFVLNVDATPLVSSRISSLEGLQDILTLHPDERHIESFLIAHPNILLGTQYVEFRSQVTIAPTGERPDFFLERVDGLWEILELKRPMSARLFMEQPAGTPLIARYLQESLKQCVRYLRLLDNPDVRNRLVRQGIRIEQPRVTLLVGKQQYSQSVVELVRSHYDSRITLRSFEELYEDCKCQTGVLLEQMRNL
jgi:hypothetical protein